MIYLSFFLLGALLAGLVCLWIVSLLDTAIPDERQDLVDWAGAPISNPHAECPPCNHRCRQGRDCPANK